MSFLPFFGLNIALALALALALTFTLEMVLVVATLKAFFDKIDIYLSIIVQCLLFYV